MFKINIKYIRGPEKRQKTPACGSSYNIPTNKKVDKKLAAGGVLFGAGWGIGGICPGPAVVALASAPSVPLAVWIFSMMVGMTVNKYLPQSIFD